MDKKKVEFGKNMKAHRQKNKGRMDENQDLIMEINLYQMEKHKNIMKKLKYEKELKERK